MVRHRLPLIDPTGAVSGTFCAKTEVAAKRYEALAVIRPKDFFIKIMICRFFIFVKWAFYGVGKKNEGFPPRREITTFIMKNAPIITISPIIE